MLRYWYDDRGEVRCENRHGLIFTLPGAPPEWRPKADRGQPRVTATPLLGEAPTPAAPLGRP